MVTFVINVCYVQNCFSGLNPELNARYVCGTILLLSTHIDIYNYNSNWFQFCIIFICKRFTYCSFCHSKPIKSSGTVFDSFWHMKKYIPAYKCLLLRWKWLQVHCPKTVREKHHFSMTPTNLSFPILKKWSCILCSRIIKNGFCEQLKSCISATQ